MSCASEPFHNGSPDRTHIFVEIVRLGLLNPDLGGFISVGIMERFVDRRRERVELTGDRNQGAS